MALSVRSPRMTEEARRLLGLLGRLPDGVALGDVEALVPGRGSAAKRRLVKVGLAHEEQHRLRVLAPVREFAREAVAPAEEDLRRAMDHYGQLAWELGPKVGKEGGAEAIARLAPETANLDAMIREGLAGSRAAEWVGAAKALTEFARMSGHASPSPLEAARKVARTLDDVPGEANCIKSLGDIALERSDPATARDHYEQALALYARIPEPYSMGATHRRLARLATAASGKKQHHVDTARALWTQIDRPDLVAQLDAEFAPPR